MAFCSITQPKGESCQDFINRIRAAALDCDYSCEKCKANTSETQIRDQFVRGLHNHTLQALLLKTASTTPDISLENLLHEARAFHQPLRDQQSISVNIHQTPIPTVHSLDRPPGHDNNLTDDACHSNTVLAYGPRQGRRSPNYQRPRSQPNRIIPCIGCGLTTHSSAQRARMCKAWDNDCSYCGTRGHFIKVCRKQAKERLNQQRFKNQTSASAHGMQGPSDNPDTDFACMSFSHPPQTDLLVPVQITPLPGKHPPLNSRRVYVFPDTGANLCLMGSEQLAALGLSPSQLTPCKLPISVVGGSSVSTSGRIIARIQIAGHSTDQTIYFCHKADRFFLGRQACRDLHIIPSSFPFPLSQQHTEAQPTQSSHRVSTFSGTTLPREPPPARPKVIPYKPISTNIPLLKKYLLKVFATSAFNKSKPFPKLSTPPAHIHLKPNYILPKPAYWPSHVADHWADTVHKSLLNDVDSGILQEVPFNEPTIWCARMVCVRKKDGRPRRTVDFQQLNAQCLREPNHCESPFHTARRVPQHTWKTVLDAVDGYHAVELDEESSKITTFITPWGRYRYLRFPQGHHSAGDAFNGRVHKVLEPIPRLVRIVDDMCAYDHSIEESFWHTWDLLTLCAHNGIVLNESKFQFCCQAVDFAGLSITPTGVQPSQRMLAAINDFPRPTDISKARSWFGLVNQVQWAYANGPDMAAFRDLVRPKSVFRWTDELEALFQEAKRRIISQVKDGVRTYDISRPTCLQTDWSKEGVGYLLLQKYCSCPMEKAPVCCPEGWRLVFAGSRFTRGAEPRYSPTEGEALAIAWALNHAHMFTKGCPNILVSTDHQPLLGIFNDKPLEAIKNHRLVRLKEQTSSFDFSVQYNRGKWHRGPDALSRNPSGTSTSLVQFMDIFSLCHESPADNLLKTDITAAPEIAAAHLNSPCYTSPDVSVISVDDLRTATRQDETLQDLTAAITNGFPATHSLTPLGIRQFFTVKDDLWLDNGIIMFKDRMVVPMVARKKVLRSLHAAHQGMDGMRARAAISVYWPGMNADLRNTRMNCHTCNEIAPSHPREPLIIIPHAEYPFHHICADYFSLSGHIYLSVVDRYSGWPIIFHYGRTHPTSNLLIANLRSIFTTYGTPEHFFSDGGPQFTSKALQAFFSNWRVTTHTSSARYPQSNGRAELSVKTAKRILEDNTAPDGSLNSDRACQSLLQYRNTPLPQLGLSPSQILFHRRLRDCIPTNSNHLRPHSSWVEAANQREQALFHRNQRLIEDYNRTAHALPPISIGSTVLIHDGSGRRRWNRIGVIVEVDNRQYTIRMHGSGRIVIRNRRFLKATAPVPDYGMLMQPTVIPTTCPNNQLPPCLSPHTVPHRDPSQSAVSALPPSRNDHIHHPDISPLSQSTPRQNPSNPTQTCSTLTPRIVDQVAIPAMLKRLYPHNRPGVKERVALLPRR